MKRAIFPILAAALLAATKATRAADAQGAGGAGAYVGGLQALSAGKYDDAEKAFSKAIAADEDNAAYYQARGVARTLGEKFDGAMSDLQRATKLSPQKDWETAGWLAIATKMNGDPSTAFAPGSAPRAEVDYAVALSDMGQNYWQSKTRGSYYDKAAKKTVQTNGAYRGDFPTVAGFYVKKHLANGAGGAGPVAGAQDAILSKIEADKAPLQALAMLQPLLDAKPDDPDLLAKEGEILMALGDVEDARQAYTELLIRRPDAAGYVGRASAAAAMGDLSHMSRDMSQAMALNPAAATAARSRMVAPGGLPTESPQALWTSLEADAKAGGGGAQLAKKAAALLQAMAAKRIRYDENYQEKRTALEADLKAHANDANRMVALARFLKDDSEVLEEHVGPRGEPRPYRVQTAADLKSDLDRADQLLDTAMRNYPDSIAVLTLKAHFLIDSRQYDAAQEIAVRALAIKADDPDLLEVFASLLQIQAARRLTAAGNLKQIKSWSETRFDQDPPMIYEYWRLPTKEELAQAAALEREANAIFDFSQQQLAKAVEGAGPTPRGLYYRATLLNVRGETKAARQALEQAVAMQPDYVEAWYQLATVCTEMQDSAGATAARAQAYNLAQTTAVAQLNSLWFKIPHNQFKAARETAAEGVKSDPADPRLPAYLAIIDEATEKPDDAMAHYRMAVALGDADLALHGMNFSPQPGRGRPLTADAAGFPAAIRLRVAALLLDQGKPAEAAEQFAAVAATLAALPAAAQKFIPDDAMLPNPDLAPGAVPLADSIAFLQIRAAAGASYAQWAVAAKSKESADLAAKTYRRILIAYNLTTDTRDALEAIADLGLAELYVQSHQLPQAQEAMKSTPAVPQDFWQEMRRTEAAARGQPGQ